jgi:hypothetical protein
MAKEDADEMSDDDCPWGYSSVWDEALRHAENENLAPLIELLRTTMPSLARLLERGKFKLRPEEQLKDIDLVLYEAACQVQALQAVQKEYRKLARKGDVSIFDKDGKLKPLLKRCEDDLVLSASSHVKKDLHKMGKSKLVEQIAEDYGLDDGALNRFLRCEGRPYRRLVGRK